MSERDAMNLASLSQPQPYTGRLRQWRNRLALLAAALMINAALFGLMPVLLTTGSREYVREGVVPPVNVIRLHHPESPVQRKSEKPPDPPPDRSAAKSTPHKAAPLNLSLPFDVNPRLPSAPNSLSLPVAPAASFEGLDDIFAAGELDSPLSVLVRVPPTYPMSAKNRGTEGWVRVRFIVHEDGSVGSITVSESMPKDIFDAAVVSSVSGWKFKPGTIGGIAVKTWAETVIRFNLD